MVPPEVYFLLAMNCRKNSDYKGGNSVGAVLVMNDSVISMGWNSYPPNVDTDFLNQLPRKERAQFAIHAEVNAILNAAKLGIKTEGSEIYITRFPCIGCITKMVKSGIKKVHFLNEKDLDTRWQSRYLFTLANTGMVFIEYDMHNSYKPRDITLE